MPFLRVKKQSGLRVLFTKWRFVRVKEINILRIFFARSEFIRVMDEDTLRVFSEKTTILRVKNVERLRVPFAKSGFVRVMDIDTLRVFSTKTEILRVNRPPAKPPPTKKEEPVSDGSEAGRWESYCFRPRDRPHGPHHLLQRPLAGSFDEGVHQDHQRSRLSPP